MWLLCEATLDVRKRIEWGLSGMQRPVRKARHATCELVSMSYVSAGRQKFCWIAKVTTRILPELVAEDREEIEAALTISYEFR